MFYMKRTCYLYQKQEFEYLFSQEDKQNSSWFPGIVDNLDHPATKNLLQYHLVDI